MMHARSLKRLLLALLLISFGFQPQEAGSEVQNTQQLIEFLIDAVAQSHLTFIRNGETHTSDEAAQHVREKYDHLRSRIKTAEDFIRLCASKSLLSGEPYLVVTEAGKVPVADWLEQKLFQQRQSQGLP